MFWWQSSSDAICTRDEEKNKMKKKSCRSKLCLRSDNPHDATEIEFSVCRMVSGGARGWGARPVFIPGDALYGTAFLTRYPSKLLQ